MCLRLSYSFLVHESHHHHSHSLDPHVYTHKVTVTYSDGRQTHTDVHRTDRDGASSLRRRTEWEQGDYLDRLKEWFWPRK